MAEQNIQPETAIKEIFLTITDPRREQRKRHRMEEILTISVMAMLCGAENFVDFERFGQCKEDWLRGFLDLPGGIPSHDTFARVFGMIDPEEFTECFRRWTEGVRKKIGGEVVALDGKTIRRSHKKGCPAAHIVSAWASENGLVLGQVKVDDKSNEITAIPELLRVLELSGCIVTIDAMGTQKEIATEICNCDAEYVLSLKANHPTAHGEVAEFFADAIKNNFKGLPHDHFQTVEKDHGRIEARRYWITSKIDWFQDKNLWEGLACFGMVERVREIDGKVSTEHAYYLCSIKEDAKTFARAVRGHWGIENKVHWTLDVTFGEDQSRARSNYQAQNLNLLRHLCLNLLKKESSKKAGIKSKQKIAGWDHAYLAKLLNF